MFEEINRQDGDPYLLRWTLLKLFGMKLMVHAFVGSDPLELHDHPWSFITFIISGEYEETTVDGTTTHKAPCILFRRVDTRHRVRIKEPALTVVITGIKWRAWGFWCGAKGDEFVHNVDYVRGVRG